MERAMTTDEKIRRAEEIYQRRRMNETRKNTARVNVAETPKDYRLFRKMILQIMVCLCIYFVFFLIKNGNYIFSEDFLTKAKEILSYDINVQEQYKSIMNYIETQEEVPDAVEEQQTPVETLSAVSEEAAVEELLEETSSVSQTLTDAGDILANYSLIKPLTGTITSRFGLRTPTTETVPKYHTGIDIAADTGTKFVAAMDGKVILVSSQGDYGNHIKIQKDDVITLYAHCNKIYVSEGDEITQGQEIGEVGATR